MFSRLRSGRRLKGVHCVFLSILFLLALTGRAAAQDDGPAPAGAAAAGAESGSTVIYDKAYFTPFAPVTLEDMIRNIPGGVTILNALGSSSDNRGFGSDGPPLLIDGSRMSGKSNDISTRLARIPASQVERIELIRGNAEGLDIRSEGLLYNVILSQGAERAASNFIDLRLNYVRGAALGPRALISHSRRLGRFDYGVSYQFENDPRVNLVHEDVLSPARTPLQFRDLVGKDIKKAHIFTANIGYDFAGGSKIRLNGLYKDDIRNDTRLEDQFLVGDNGALTLFALEQALFRYDTQEWELGGDAETSLGFLGELKALFVITRRARDDNFSQDLTQGSVTNRFFSQIADIDEGETIMRASVSTPIGARHSLEYGGEGAFNTLDTTFSFNADPLANAIVEEDRYEAFITHNFMISDQLNLQTGVTQEFSTIFQNRDGVSNMRKFDFLKPRVELRYDLTTDDQFRLLAERTVSQLNLNDFVASRNIDDDVINFGNPNLSPEATWRYSMGYERRFKGGGGAFQIELFYENIQDHIDKVLIGTASSGVGNIGDARRLGVETEVNTRLGFFSLPNAVFTLRYNYQDTSTTDPFTGEKRPIRASSPHFWDVDFRHDIDGTKFAYGFNGHRRTILHRQDISLREIVRYKRHVEAYGEYDLTPRVKIRFTAHRFLGDKRTADKTFYVGNIADGVVDRIDVQASSIRTEYELRLQGTF